MKYSNIMANESFRQSFEQLADVHLNPRRHNCRDAKAHSLLVSSVAQSLGRQNNLSDEQVLLLGNLGLARYLGKASANGDSRLTGLLLRQMGIDSPSFLNYLSWYTTHRPWYHAHQRGQDPTDESWQKLAQLLDMNVLSLFVIAAYSDSPRGWRRHQSLQWFLGEVRQRQLVGELGLDLPGLPSERCAGAVLLRKGEDGPEVLMIRIRRQGYELPKGGLEEDESMQEAACRELKEETGLRGTVQIGSLLGKLVYEVKKNRHQYTKGVNYFAARGENLYFDKLPSRTRERRWVNGAQLSEVDLVNEELRGIVLMGLDSYS